MRLNLKTLYYCLMHAKTIGKSGWLITGLICHCSDLVGKRLMADHCTLEVFITVE